MIVDILLHLDIPQILPQLDLKRRSNIEEDLMCASSGLVSIATIQYFDIDTIHIFDGICESTEINAIYAVFNI